MGSPYGLGLRVHLRLCQYDQRGWGPQAAPSTKGYWLRGAPPGANGVRFEGALEAAKTSMRHKSQAISACMCHEQLQSNAQDVGYCAAC